MYRDCGEGEEMSKVEPKLSGGTEPHEGAAPKRRARAHTRAAIIDAAEALFAEHGTPSASIDEICARAGFTRGAFYSNFRTVDDVFFALYERKTAALIERLRSHAVASRPAGLADSEAGGTLEAVVDELLAVIPADAQWYALRALYGLRAAADPALSAVLREHGEAFQAGFIPVLTQIADSVGGALLPDVEEAARVVTAAHVGSVLQGAFADDPARLRRDTVLAALSGVLSPVPPAAARPPRE